MNFSCLGLVLVISIRGRASRFHFFSGEISVRKQNQLVILSAVSASRSEAVAQSKDPYSRNALRIWSRRGKPAIPYIVEQVGVLRLRISIRKRMQMLRSR